LGGRPKRLFEKSAEFLGEGEFAMSEILSWASVALGLAMAVFAPHPGSAATNLSGQTNSVTLPSGALVQLSPILQPSIIGSFAWTFSGSPSAITPDRKYMYVLINTYQIGNPPKNGSNKILTYVINADGTLTPPSDPQAGPNTTATAIYITNQGHTLLTVNTDGSSSSANTAPFEIFTIEADGSLSLVPNSIQLPAAMTVLSMATIGPQATDGSGQYFYVALIDNDPNDSGYMTSSTGYAFQISPNGALRYASVFSFTLPQQAIDILNVIADTKFLYVFGESNAYVSTIGSNGTVQPPVKSTPYNDNNFFGDAFFGMQISPDGENFYAIDSTNGSLNSLGVCDYPINSDGTIQFPAKDCQNIFNNVAPGEGFGADGLYISPENKFLYSLFETSVEDTCTASIYSYIVNTDGSLGALNFSSASPANSVPIGNNFCAQALAGAPDGSYLYAFGATGSEADGYKNTIVPFRIQTGLTSPGPATDPLDTLIVFVGTLRLPSEIKRALIAALVAAQQRLDAHRLGSACSTLAAFTETAVAVNENTLDAADAAKLVAQATAISESVGCQR
jgi:hypothetical protein